jgi:cytochrome c
MREITAMRVAAVACLLIGTPQAARAQFTIPAAPVVVDGATLFARQCGTCHVATAEGGPRQGPNLHGVFGRRAGSVAGFAYSPGYASSGVVWDEASLDSYLTNPQAMISGSVMAYRQADPSVRHGIIAWLREQG